MIPLSMFTLVRRLRTPAEKLELSVDCCESSLSSPLDVALEVSSLSSLSSLSSPDDVAGVLLRERRECVFVLLRPVREREDHVARSASLLALVCFSDGSLVPLPLMMSLTPFFARVSAAFAAIAARHPAIIFVESARLGVRVRVCARERVCIRDFWPPLLRVLRLWFSLRGAGGGRVATRTVGVRLGTAVAGACVIVVCIDVGVRTVGVVVRR